MKRRTYRAFLSFAIAVVLLSAGLALWFGLARYRSTPQSDDIPAVGFESAEELHSNDSQLIVHFFDVGEADSSLVECNGHYMLIDGGNPRSSSFLYAYLQQHNIDYLDYIVCSHPHTDHVGGLAGALNYATVGVAYAPIIEYDSRAFNSFIKYLDRQSKTITVPKAGDTIRLGDADVIFIAPLGENFTGKNLNNASIILKIVFGDTSFLFTGDAEVEEETSVTDSGVDIRSTLLKVGHHGSNTSSSVEFLEKVKPDYAVISVGKDNEYGHPHSDAMERLLAVHAEIFRTDLNGEITCVSDGSSLAITSERH